MPVKQNPRHFTEVKKNNLETQWSKYRNGDIIQLSWDNIRSELKLEETYKHGNKYNL